MTTEEFLRRHFSRMGARLHITEASGRQWAKIRIDIGRDRSGEFFDIRCGSGVVPEVLDVQPDRRHMVLMVRDGNAKTNTCLAATSVIGLRRQYQATTCMTCTPLSTVSGPLRLKAVE